MNIWEGVYRSFEEAGGNIDGFTELWVERSTEKARRLIEEARAPGFIPSTGYALPLVAAMVQARRGCVSILDFGGSVGLSFPSIAAALSDPNEIEMVIVDNESICRAGRNVFAGDQRIRFHVQPPAIPFDIVHCGSSIQYVSDWAAAVRELTTAAQPAYLIFDDVPAGNIETFVSLQNYYDKKIPHWFFNAREFIETVTRETGYELCYKARYVATVLGQVGPLPMGNFPVEMRIENACNLVFGRGRK